MIIRLWATSGNSRADSDHCCQQVLTGAEPVDPLPVALERLRIGICLAIIALITFLGGATVVLCYTSLGDRLMAAAAMAGTVIVACGWRLAVPYLPVITTTWQRVAVGTASIACGFVACSFYVGIILPHVAAGPDGALPAIGLLGPFIIAVFTCLGMGLCLGEKEREMYGMTRREISAAA